MPYQYKECGLNDVYLTNGYRFVETNYGRAVEIDGRGALHRAIAKAIVFEKPQLSGPEFRFLRKELDMTQKAVADAIGYDVQTVALWEKRSRVPKWADLGIRYIYRDYVNNNSPIKGFVDQRAKLERERHATRLTLNRKPRKGWESRVTRQRATA